MRTPFKLKSSGPSNAVEGAVSKSMEGGPGDMIAKKVDEKVEEKVNKVVNQETEEGLV